MGQYYKVINLDKKQFIKPWTFNDGAKLLEFGCSGSGTMLALAVLLASGNNRGGGDLHSENSIVGSWRGNRIIVAGDYDDYIDEKEFNKTGKLVFIGDDKATLDKRKEAHKKFQGLQTLYSLAGNNWEDISVSVIEALIDDNYIKSEYALSLITRNNDAWSVVVKDKLKEEVKVVSSRIKRQVNEFAIVESVIKGAISGSLIKDDVKQMVDKLLWSVRHDIERNGSCPW
jgi:hypothetical protein